MPTSPIVIKRIRLEALRDYARSFTGPSPTPGIAPITVIRACSQAKNPYARPADTALLVAVCGDRVVGYHGVVPGLLATDGSLSRVHWSSAVFVAEQYRGLGVGRQLIAAFKSLGKDVAVPGGMTPSAEGAYRSGGFQATGELNYFQLRLARIDRTAPLFQQIRAHASVAGKPLESPVKWLSRQTAKAQKAFFYRRAAARLPIPPGKQWRPVDRLFRFDRRPPPGRAVFFRGTDAVNWMLARPWVYSRDEITAADLTHEVRHYYFTKTRPLFRYAAYELTARDGKSGRGFVVFSLSRSRRRTVVRVLDHEIQEAAMSRTACGLALAAARTILADRIELPPSLAAPFQNDTMLRRLIKPQSLTGVGYPGRQNSPLAGVMGHVELGLCDGDSAFT
jgi:GNAT superfamily N-acetyltransferase